MPRRRPFLALVVAVLAASPGTAAAKPFRVLATHLDRPRGLAVAPDGALYATLVGHGGRPCNQEGCFGASGRIVRVRRNGHVRTIASGLLSMRGRPDGFFSLGADQLALLPDGRLATAISAEFEGPTGVPPAQVPPSVRGQAGHLVIASRDGGKEIGADLAAPEFATDPDGEGAVSNPYGVAVAAGALYVSDSAGNDLLAVNGPAVSVLTTFPHAGFEQSVPDALAAGPDGALYVGEFTGGAQARGAARIWRVVPGQAPVLFASGLTSITALAVGPDGSVYATQFRPGNVVRIRPDGSRTVLARHRLHFPGGIAVARDGTVFVSDWTVAGAVPARHGELKGATGRIVRIR
jgi:glucose/arabinose dehydrogenase